MTHWKRHTCILVCLVLVTLIFYCCINHTISFTFAVITGFYLLYFISICIDALLKKCIKDNAGRNIVILIVFGAIFIVFATTALILYHTRPELSVKFGIFSSIVFFYLNVASIIQNHISQRETSKRFDKIEIHCEEILDKIDRFLLKSKELVKELNMSSDIQSTLERITPQADHIEDITNGDQWKHKFGERLLLESIVKVPEFCKFMITTNIALIPTYTALFKFARPENYQLQNCDKVPIWLFLFSAMLFTFAYIPVVRDFSQDKLIEITKRHFRMIHSRKISMLAGFFFLYAGVIWGFMSIL